MSRSNSAEGGSSTRGMSQSSLPQSSNPSLIDEDNDVQQFAYDGHPSIPEVMSSVRVLPFLQDTDTPTFAGMNSHVATLENEHSSYFSFSKACLFFNHLASYGSSSATPPSLHVVESNLFQAEEYATNFTIILNTLSSASSNHSDRRCRILALNSLSIISKAIVAKLVTTPVYLSPEDVELIIRLQDDICNDVVMNIVSSALEDDDGVASVAFESLGRLVIDLNEGPFMKEVGIITGQFTPLVLEESSGLWEDSRTWNKDIRSRILKNVLAPRVRNLFNRIQLMRTTEGQLRCLPFLQEVIIYAYKLNAEEKVLDKETYANRWFEYDADVLVQEYVDTFVIPLMGNCEWGEEALSGNLLEIRIGASTNALMLCSAVKGDETWLQRVIPLAIRNLEQGLDLISEYGCLEEEIIGIATLLVALRGTNIESKVATLQRIVAMLVKLPSTRIIPPQVITAALRHSDGTQRKSVRIGLWTEIAISLLLPDTDTKDHFDIDPHPGRFKEASAQISSLSSLLNSFLTLGLLRSGHNERKKAVLDPSQEIIFSFCSVAHSIGKSVTSLTSKKNNYPSLKFEQDVWVGTSLLLLQFFMPCLGWSFHGDSQKGESQDMQEEPSHLLFAAQKAYIELLVSVLVQAGSILPTSSIYFHFILSSTASDIQEKVSTGYLDPIFLTNSVVENDIDILLDKLGPLTKSVASRKNRLSLMCSLTDAWIQHCQQATMISDESSGDNEGPVDVDNDVININERHAQTVLSVLGSEISSLIDEEKKKPSHMASRWSDPGAMTGEGLRSLLTCISCVESIAYTAQLTANHFASSKANVDDEESARYIVSVCIVVLRGQGKIESDRNEDDLGEEGSLSESSESQATASPPRSPRSRARITAFTSECAAAAKRLRQFVGTNDIDEPGQISIDFNCLCPLFKLPNFGVPEEKESSRENQPHLQTNNNWKVAEKISSVDFDIEEMNPFVTPISISPSIFIGAVDQFNENVFFRGLLIQLCRQQVCLQIGHAIQCGPQITTVKNSFVQPENPLRRVPDPSTTAESFLAGSVSEQIQDVVVERITGCSDLIYSTLTCSARRQSRLDGETEFKTVLYMRVQNITPIDVTNGLQLKLIMTPRNRETESKRAYTFEKRNSSYFIDTLYPNNLKGGSHLTWEIVMDSCLDHDISASVILKDISQDTPLLDDSLAGAKNVIISDGNGTIASHTKDVEFTNDSNFSELMSKNSQLLPNPIVFFFGRTYGDEKAFIYLWQNVSHFIRAYDVPMNQTAPDIFTFLTDASSLDIRCTSGCSVRSWALMSSSGKHLLAVSITSATEGNSASTLYFRTDDPYLLHQISS